MASTRLSNVAEQKLSNKVENTRTPQIACLEASNALHPIDCSDRAGFDMHSSDNRRWQNE
jgi:hypothetical protein